VDSGCFDSYNFDYSHLNFFDPQKCGFGCGVIFKLDTAGKETPLFTSTGGNGGSNPNVGFAEPTGDLYGTAAMGGNTGDGTVFRITHKSGSRIFHSFSHAEFVTRNGNLSVTSTRATNFTTESGGDIARYVAAPSVLMRRIHEEQCMRKGSNQSFWNGRLTPPLGR
jgi:uncharacterized repeat protein (TIGR03803 family)